MGKLALQHLRECLPVFQTLGDSNRQEILMLLHEHGTLTVNELTDKLRLSRPAVSHHLKLLLQAGLVACEQRGTQRRYSITLEASVALLKKLLAALEEDCL
ncbi:MULTISPECIES: metalloregulator ArsR/SmtB family transcription factor [unclassified Paenibacillus]|uniref:ArsR/SmtB family transcription factor n=1 Tax=unclassified Paenibacillus TaxID=185978 RepID=UPI000956E744|nr:MULTISPECIES: metalloregulator ArsR/SmtB family transcription factor [unclassified Paenibacillus]ASS64810.1 winged helix-turn-helix transcriptional regulator [Paenibacillus sp. RUD330]SIR05276.1 regulatory protein, arsR family [Paenibacillus sp. RU4X]SIR30111.1 regulatory protein, arsR family [Paenibacillus sp. RU4T]